MADTPKTVFVDCEAGRRMGCDTFCCRLLVRLKAHEMEKTDGHRAAKGFVDKDETGICVHLNRETWGCDIWETRPETCREYDCNSDFLLQIVLREGFTNIADVAKKAATAYIPKESYITIPVIEQDSKEK
jgi:Fe-S-cluster containining protein